MRAAALGDDGARQRRTDLVNLLSQHPSDHLSDRLRLASLALDSDALQPAAEVAAAAQQALRLGDLSLPNGWRRARWSGPDGLVARLVLGQALAWQGRGREADAVLAASIPPDLSEPELMAWAVPRAANQFWMLGEPEKATAFLQTIRNRVTEPAARTALDALTATFAMNAGNLAARDHAGRRCAGRAGRRRMAVAWAASAAALSSARMGRFGDVERLAERASAAEHPGLLRFTVGLGQITALLMAGRSTQAQSWHSSSPISPSCSSPAGRSVRCCWRYVLLFKGEFAAAAAYLGPAAAELERTGYSWGPLSLMLLATALAQQGDIPGSAKALRRAETRHGTKSALFAPELGVARAWPGDGAGQDGAVTAAREAARTAERAGQSAVALRAWHDAIRLGDVRAAEPATRLAPK